MIVVSREDRTVTLSVEDAEVLVAAAQMFVWDAWKRSEPDEFLGYYFMGRFGLPPSEAIDVEFDCMGARRLALRELDLLAARLRHALEGLDHPFQRPGISYIPTLPKAPAEPEPEGGQ